MAIPEALPRMQQPQIFSEFNEPTPRNKTLQKVAIFGILLGLGLLFVTTIPLVYGAGIAFFSSCSWHYLQKIDAGNKLVAAASEGNLCMLKFLLFLGANPNISNPRHQTPLYWAVGSQRDEAAAILLNYGANPMIRSYELFAIDGLNPNPTVYEYALHHQRKFQEDPAFRNERIRCSTDTDLRTRQQRQDAANRLVELLRPR